MKAASMSRMAIGAYLRLYHKNKLKQNPIHKGLIYLNESVTFIIGLRDVSIITD